MKSQNIVFTAKERVELLQEPVAAPGAGEVMIRARKTLISTGTECIVLQQKFEPGTHWAGWGKFPFHPGYSLAGVVEQVGPDATRFKPGDRVIIRQNHHQFITAPETACLPIPDGVSDEDATWFGLANIVQNGVRTAEHKLGDAVVLIGLGLLGQLTVQYVNLLGARAIVAVDPVELRLTLAAAHGATHSLNLRVEEAAAQVGEITGGRMADVVYDITGFPAVLRPSLALARKFGTVLVLGDTGSPGQQSLSSDFMGRGLKLVAAHDSHPTPVVTDRDYWTHPNMTALFMSYLQRGQMRVSDLVTHRFNPADCQGAFDLLMHDRGSAMGVIFDWEQLS